MKEIGFVQLSRRMLIWRWSGKLKNGYLYIILLLIANFTQADFDGHTIRNRKFKIHLNSLMQQSCLSYQDVITALSLLKLTKYLTVEVFWKYKVFTVKNNEIISYTTNKLTIN